MISFNQVILLGYLGKDPEVLKPQEKGAFVRLSVATTKKYTDTKGKLQEETQWHSVYVKNGLGKAVAEYLKKGSRVHITGELRKRSWVNKEEQLQFNTAVHAFDIIFLDAKNAALPESSDIQQ